MRRATGAPRRLAAAVASAVVLAACVGERGAPDSRPRSPTGRRERSESLVIALVGTLSGPEAWRGEDAFEGADLAVHELNQGVEEGELLFEVVALDDGGDVNEATRRMGEVASLERAVGVIYAGPPEGLPPAEEALAASGIPAVLAYGDLYGPRKLSPHVFQASPSYVWGARRLAAYLLHDRRYRRVGVLAESSAQGDAAVAALRDAMEGTRPVVARYGTPAVAGRRLERLRRGRVEAIVVHGTPSAFSAVLEGLRDLGASYRTTAAARIASAPPRMRRKRAREGVWRPQVAGLDQAISTVVEGPIPPGTVAVDSYARGAHYLPVPNFRDFARAFRSWWDDPPLGWEQRAYDAARAIGWAARRAEPGQDLAVALEGLADRRFGGGDIVLGPDDHTFIDQTAVGIWTVPRRDLAIRPRRPPAALPWAPLARGFAIGGERTDLPPADWKHLFRRPPPPGAPAPPARRMRYSVATGRADLAH